MNLKPGTVMCGNCGWFVATERDLHDIKDGHIPNLDLDEEEEMSTPLDGVSFGWKVGEWGTAYTTTEARQVAEWPEIDKYPSDLILKLCDALEEAHHGPRMADAEYTCRLIADAEYTYRLIADANESMLEVV